MPGNDTQSSVQPPSQHTVGKVKTMMKAENPKVHTGVECSSYRWGPCSVCSAGGPIQSHVCLGLHSTI